MNKPQVGQQTKLFQKNIQPVHFALNTVFITHHIRLDGGNVYEESDPVDLTL